MDAPQKERSAGMPRTKKLTTCALLTALALILSYVEFLLPLSAAVPGIKLGLANIVVLMCLYLLGPRETFFVNCTRIALAALLFGSVFSALYALAGGLVSLFVMIALKRSGHFGPAGISAAGGVFHNLGQLAVAAAVIHSPAVVYYLPVLLFAGLAAGTATGVVSALVLRRLKPGAR